MPENPKLGQGVQVQVNTLIFIAISLLLTSCNIKNVRSEKDPSTHSVELLKIQQEVSLSSDRDELGKLRKDTPEPVIEDNDELKFILDFFTDIRQQPSRIKSKFDRIVRRKQEKFRKQIRKQRKSFSKTEREKRKVFLKEQKDNREDFLDSDQNTKEGRKEYFDKQDEKRKVYFANARDHRKDFEAQVKEIQKDTNSYFREKKKQFRDELRIFKRKHKEWKKDQKKKAKLRLKSKDYNTSSKAGSLYPMKKQRPQRSKSKLEKEFEEIDTIPSQALESE